MRVECKYERKYACYLSTMDVIARSLIAINQCIDFNLICCCCYRHFYVWVRYAWVYFSLLFSCRFLFFCYFHFAHLSNDFVYTSISCYYYYWFANRLSKTIILFLPLDKTVCFCVCFCMWKCTCAMCKLI